MRVNIYAEELPEEKDVRAVEIVTKQAKTGQTFFGVRIFLQSASGLHDKPEDDDRSAVTFWGPRKKVSNLLHYAAGALDASIQK